MRKENIDNYLNKKVNILFNTKGKQIGLIKKINSYQYLLETEPYTYPASGIYFKSADVLEIKLI